MTKHHGQGNLEKKAFNFIYSFRWIRVRDGRAKAWYHQQLRDHILIQSRRPRRAHCECQESFETFKTAHLQASGKRCLYPLQRASLTGAKYSTLGASEVILIQTTTPETANFLVYTELKPKYDCMGFPKPIPWQLILCIDWTMRSKILEFVSGQCVCGPPVTQ